MPPSVSYTDDASDAGPTERSTQEVIDSHLANRRMGRVSEDLEHNYAEFFYDMVLIDGPFAFLQWRAVARDMHVSSGADSFVVRDGRICMQTISYTLSTRPSARSDPAR